ncbi:MAG TPA: hypothetical protein VNM72_06605 [Blastocatellia bacterium]|nr:hypothetical protein [Blastocatellia bacterium]
MRQNDGKMRQFAAKMRQNDETAKEWLYIMAAKDRSKTGGQNERKNSILYAKLNNSSSIKGKTVACMRFFIDSDSLFRTATGNRSSFRNVPGGLLW